MSGPFGSGPLTGPGDSDRHGGKIREAAARLGAGPRELLDFSANVNFLGPTEAVLAAARGSLDEVAWYPCDPPERLREAVAGFLGVPPEQVLLGNGASELIFLVVAWLRPRRVLVVGPTFTEYARAARAWGAEAETLWLPAERDFALRPSDLDPAAAAAIARADLLFYCEPNNPTGDLLDPAARARLLELAAAAGTPVFADESFLAFTSAWPAGSVTGEGRENILVLHSLTKILAMPGLRVGALVVPPALVGELGPRVPPWNLNCVGQAAALAALEEPGVLAATAGAVAAARRAFRPGLEALPGVAQVLPAAANFLCLRLSQPQAGEVVERVRDEHAILLRDLSGFPGLGPHYLRLAVRSPEENRLVGEALAAVLSGPAPLQPSLGRVVEVGS